MATKRDKSSAWDNWPIKAYKNQDFLSSPDARTVRMLCEYLEPLSRFREFRVKDTIAFFGSARTLSTDVAGDNLAKLEARKAADGKADKDLARQIQLAQRDMNMSRYYEDARALARRLTEWSHSMPNGG
ncbi:unnamed protein product, partial [marine sediment metagenome]